MWQATIQPAADKARHANEKEKSAAGATAGMDGAGKRPATRPPPDPRKMVRLNVGMAAGELDKYVTRGGLKTDENVTRGAPTTDGAIDQASSAKPPVSATAVPSTATPARGDESSVLVMTDPSTCGAKRCSGSEAPREWVACELTSIHSLLKAASGEPRPPPLRRPASAVVLVGP